MVNSCSITGCSNRSDREKHLSFYCIPAIRKHKGQQVEELSRKRREKWLANINRNEWEPVTSSRVCSAHFITGRPAYLHLTDDPDWVPTLNMGHTVCVSKPRGAPVSFHPYVRTSQQQQQRTSPARRDNTASGVIPITLHRHHATNLERDNVLDLSRLSQGTADNEMQTNLPVETQESAYSVEELSSLLRETADNVQNLSALFQETAENVQELSVLFKGTADTKCNGHDGQAVLSRRQSSAPSRRMVGTQTLCSTRDITSLEKTIEQLRKRNRVLNSRVFELERRLQLPCFQAGQTYIVDDE